MSGIRWRGYMKSVERSCSWLSPFLVRVVFTNLITRVVSG
jgi:hypothetical protein